MNQPRSITIVAPEDDNGKKQKFYETHLVYLSFISDKGTQLELTYCQDNQSTD
jgi:hypothetical protein